MPDTRTERLNAIADLELEEPGNYTAAASVRAVAVERDELADELARLKDDYKTIVAQGHGYKVERDRLVEVNAGLRERVLNVVAFCDELERGLAADCVRLTGELAVARGLLRDDLTDRNAERYEWLRDNVSLSNSNNYGNATGLAPRDQRRVYRLEWHGPACNGDLDEIVDACRSGPEGRAEGQSTAGRSGDHNPTPDATTVAGNKSVR